MKKRQLKKLIQKLNKKRNARLSRKEKEYVLKHVAEFKDIYFGEIRNVS